MLTRMIDLRHPSFAGRVAAILAVSGAFVADVAAQPDAGQILNEQRQTQPRPIERLPQPEVERERLPAPAPGATTVVIRSIRITGGEGLASEAELQAQVADAIGRELDYAGLHDLADRLTRYLKDKGFLLAYAYLPAQSLEQGILEIAIQSGRIDGSSGIEIQADGARLDPDRMRGIVAGAILRGGDGAPLEAANLERGLLLLNDLPGIVARGTLEPGTTPGTSKVAVRIEEGPLLSGDLSFDDYGNRYSGTWRTSAQLSLNDPLRIGDQAKLSLTHATGIDQLGVAYRLPVGSDGWMVGLSLGSLEYRIGEEFANLHLRGTARTAQLNATYPLIRTRDRNLWGSISYDRKRLTDLSFDEPVRDKRVNAVTLGLNGNQADAAGRWLSTFGASLLWGNLDLSGVADDQAGDNRTARSAGTYSKLSLNMAQLQRLGDGLSLYASASGQLAGKNLDSSEKFMLGGPNGVRAFPIGEASGDSGWLANVEVRYDLPQIGSFYAPQLLGFVDVGGIRLHEHPWRGSAANMGSANSYQLSGVGIGLNLATAEGVNLRFAFAVPLSGNPGRAATTGMNADGRSDHRQFWGQITVAF